MFIYLNLFIFFIYLHIYLYDHKRTQPPTRPPQPPTTWNVTLTITKPTHTTTTTTRILIIVLFWFLFPIQTFVVFLCLTGTCLFTMYINIKNITLHGFIRLCFHLNVNVNMLGMCRAHGYVYTASTNTSFVPNSRVDSERASVSSGGRTDSDTMSLSSCSMWVVPPSTSTSSPCSTCDC